MDVQTTACFTTDNNVTIATRCVHINDGLLCGHEYLYCEEQIRTRRPGDLDGFVLVLPVQSLQCTTIRKSKLIRAVFP